MSRPRLEPEDLQRVRVPSQAVLSPNGQHVAWVTESIDDDADTTTQRIHLARTDEGAEPRVFTRGKKDHAPAWSPDGRTLGFVSTREGSQPQIYLIDVDGDGGEARPLTHAEHGVSRFGRRSVGGPRHLPPALARATRPSGEHADAVAARRRRRTLPQGQSEELFNILVRVGRAPVEMVWYPGGSHHFPESGLPSHRIDYVRRTVEWCERWASPESSAARSIQDFYVFEGAFAKPLAAAAEPPPLTPNARLPARTSP